MRRQLGYPLWAVVAVVVALAATLLAPAASAQSVADIEARDTLIANQEALLNVYRCMFDVDTEIVPGGCVEGKPAMPATEPQPFTGTPSEAETAVRDQLVVDQEALLNVYRCLFDIDTQIVPGGCSQHDSPDTSQGWVNGDWTTASGEEYRRVALTASNISQSYPSGISWPVLSVQCNPSDSLFLYIWAGDQRFPDDGRGEAFVDMSVKFDNGPTIYRHGSAAHDDRFLHLSESYEVGRNGFQPTTSLLASTDVFYVGIDDWNQAYAFNLAGFEQWAAPLIADCGEHFQPWSDEALGRIGESLSDIGCLFGFGCT